MVRSYRDLVVWRKSMRASLALYRLTAAFPAEEKFGLSAQLRRAAVSIPSNIAEGHERRGRKDYLGHVNVARGSLAEAETQLLLAQALGFANSHAIKHLLEEYAQIGRMLTKLSRALGRKPGVPSPHSPPGPRP